ncbi:hypothetical protein U9M48_028754 [Paspalum notatum var. saurae]|uniref:AB hydrolase-1 domain-containing protein n=1 Tax=Paspalum notatum var. saurae TaxID=547442 RepID=A0AAQ3TXG7_PASNO
MPSPPLPHASTTARLLRRRRRQGMPTPLPPEPPVHAALTRPSSSMVIACLRGICCPTSSKPKPKPKPNQKTKTMAAGDDHTTTAITHRTMELSTGVRLHVAEAGPAAPGAPTVLLLHGFPELWYTWRHQMRALAAAGYRAVAPDLRGYGDSSGAAPELDDPAGQYTALHVVGDLVALIDALGEERVFVAAHDWGALTAWSLCLFRPDRVRALVALSAAYTPRSAALKPVDGLRALYGDDFYICRIQEPGAIEAEFARLGTELVIRKFLAGSRTPGPLFIPKGGWGSPDDEVPLPSWVTEEDLKYYTSKFEKTGFTGPLKYYRIQDFIHKGGFKKFVPLLDDVVVVMNDVGHFINEEKPEEVSNHIMSFIEKFN